MEVVVPWPPAALSPNKRLHWAIVAKEKRNYRKACFDCAVSQGVKRIEASRLHVELVFVPPTRRRYDIDNLLARMKSGLDGIADLIGVDDSKWDISIRRNQPPGGFVFIRITPCDETPCDEIK